MFFEEKMKIIIKREVVLVSLTPISEIRKNGLS